ncbi:MAG: hypothetical protein A3A04_00835 [Candidatus Harrisonbacteria bacterium RIFCSPLOWO2_01_FULL_40_28]|uniref:DUF5667 domain-containing protein n=1 Tax=Candidatus Harrisonbacteria bacterium RIFCSPLOWO2_01_FULL_40_28 TaxID=1798406 RepID=A0A1G1ZNT5_9BACT|nr:MAG: hypothetical protein A3A04_00835 [Candidatus Harrisonbacteria bacterium RIFCSPLOWO2_01_FULL_40_28]
MNHNSLIAKLFILSITIMPLFAHGASNTENLEPLKSAINDLTDTVDKLVITKDTPLLTPEEKIEQERASRLSTFREILNLASIEIKDLETKLNALKDTDLSEEERVIKDTFLRELKLYATHYKEIKAELDNENASLEELKIIARNLKEWRVSYEANLEEMFNFLSLFQSETLLDTAEERWEKISKDLTKIKKSGLPTANLQKLLGKAKGNLDASKKLNTDAYETFMKPWRIATSSTSSTASLLVPPQNSSSEPALLNPTRVALQQSLINIKNAYQSFFEMNKIVKLLIK